MTLTTRMKTTIRTHRTVICSALNPQANEADVVRHADEYDSLYQRLPGRGVDGGDRFSAYGAILRLCERAPETAFLDRPTFRRLPLVR